MSTLMTPRGTRPVAGPSPADNTAWNVLFASFAAVLAVGIAYLTWYNFAPFFMARADANASGPVTISIVSDDGKTVYASEKFSGLTTGWKKFETVLKTGGVTPSTKAHFAITLDRPGTIWLGMVSLFPPTWNDRPNGLRKDLMQMMVDMNPKFLRFPGGNYVEGDTIETRFGDVIRL